MIVLHPGNQYTMTGTAQGKGTEAQLTWSPQAPPLLTAAVQDVSRDTSAFYWESYALVSELYGVHIFNPN